MNKDGNNFNQSINYNKAKTMKELFSQNNNSVFINEEKQNINLNSSNNINNMTNQSIQYNNPVNNQNYNIPIEFNNDYDKKENDAFMKYFLWLNNKKSYALDSYTYICFCNYYCWENILFWEKG